eukprot:NODE_836_length_1348_cov_3.029389.p2 GENE.NODE_836_length_1348_cov_3.029389~~NODE_836_length_1348_cov_3.029389.p2  ORF type:complete len:272 (+),score=118.81 NODE_836_length_1348_cov_3.029389:215-1030(+)
MLYVLSTSMLNLPERHGKHYEGSNKGTALGPIKLKDVEEEWSATVKFKRSLYGTKARIAVGGKTAGGTPAKRQDDATEPIFWKGMPPNFYDEVLHRFFAKNVVDLTAGNGEFMLQSVRNRVGYFGICLTSIHKTELEKMARIYILKAMCDETCALYSPKCAEAFEKYGVDKEGEQKGEEQAKKKKGGGKRPKKDDEGTDDEQKGEDDEKKNGKKNGKRLKKGKKEKNGQKKKGCLQRLKKGERGVIEDDEKSISDLSESGQSEWDLSDDTA